MFAYYKKTVSMNSIDNLNIISSRVSIINRISLHSHDDSGDDVVQVVTKDSAKERETWHGRMDFFLSCLGYAVGLGSIWRFPYLVYKHGGGAFLIPFMIFLLFLGIPLVFLELTIGQFTSSGPLTSWSMIPIFRGIGLSMNIVNFYLIVYFNMLIGYSLYFLVLSMKSSLIWDSCDKQWSSKNCIDNYTNFKFTECLNNLKCNDGVCYSNHTNASCLTNKENLTAIGWWNPVFPSEDFWKKVILKQSSGIEETGDVVWQLVLCLLSSWLIVYTLVVKGMKFSGRLQYFTSLTPFLILFVLGVRGWVLPGASVGIKYYITPDFSRLLDIQCWIDAALQIFFTLSISYGGLIALSSYNNFHKNIMRDAIMVSISNCLISILAGFVVFAYIGHIAYMSQETGHHVDHVVQVGQGFSYVMWPYAVSKIQGGPFWSFIFFLMCTILGVNSMITSVETFNISILDLIPSLKKTHLRKILTISIICVISFLSGLVFCTQSGSFWLQIFDEYAGNWAILVVAGLELISVGWFYGFNNFRKDISTMIGERITNHVLFNLWRVCWSFISPAIIFTLVICYFLNIKAMKADNDYVYPYWTKIFGNLLTTTTLSGVVIWAVYLIIDSLFINKQPLIELFRPSKKFKPLRPEHQILVSLVHSDRHEEKYNKKREENKY